MSAGHILLVEDRASLRRMLERALTGEGYETSAVATGEEAIALLGERPFDVALTDLKLPGLSGIEVLAAAREAQPGLPVVVLTAFGTVRTAVEAMRLGAVDFLEKPLEIDDLLSLVASLTGSEEESLSLTPPGLPPIVGRHPRMRAAMRLLERVAPTDSTVLLTGASGTGKELFAGALHALSPRREGPFVAVNCAAIPETLLENELFGHEKGAFTGAHRQQAGRFEQARGGTLLLDEIGELESGIQSKVLRVLEEKTFEPVGGGRTVKADVRLVAATNRDLKAMVEEGQFRSDLYYRLDVFPIEIPPLRERASDIPLLAGHLLERLARRHQRPAPRLTDEAARLLEGLPWPGNVRELANLLERCLIMSDAGTLGEGDLRPLIDAAALPSEADRLRRALEEADGDKRQAAEILGVSYRTLQRRVREHDLEGFPKYRR